MKKIILSLALSCWMGHAVQAQQKHSFALSQSDFMLDGKPFQMISGEMHPARIPHE
ncbi:beta-galactosidase [Chitinophaga sp. HK235]|nr:beta-galactosidase [Chitinophaga sp. HK235]